MMDVRTKRLRGWISTGVVVAVVAIGATYALTRTTRWPAAFCRPVLRVSGVDADAFVKLPYSTPTATDCVNVTTATGTRQRCHAVPAPPLTGPTITSPVASTDLAQLHRDALLALRQAPTTQWRNELSYYVARTVGNPKTFMRGGALNDFDVFASTHLGACGVHPLGRR
jgi:hypothetical protein